MCFQDFRVVRRLAMRVVHRQICEYSSKTEERRTIQLLCFITNSKTILLLQSGRP